MEQTRVFLIGLPGAGKTTLGKELAESLSIPFVDLDMEIEKAEGMPIKDIFEKKQEDYFRDQESKLLKKWCSSGGSFVMATGGGTPCFADNMDIINASGTSIFLDVPPKEISRRVSGAAIADRPLLSKTNFDTLTSQIDFMRTNRVSFYRKAKISMVGGAITVRQIMAKIKTGSQP